MEKLIKKNDQIIGFIRKQEQDILRPMLEAITTTEERIKANIGSLATSDKLIEFIQAVDSNSNIQVDTRDKLAETISKQNKEVKQAILTLARYLDEKGKAGLIDRLFG
jgi:gas vesicle protein